MKSQNVKNWAPGAYVLLSIPRFGFGQSHPATIASTPSSHDNDLVFILRTHNGFTKHISQAAGLSDKPTQGPKVITDSHAVTNEKHIAVIDGPYGASHSDFAAFDTTILIAGSTGVTFSIAILLGLAARAGVRKLPLRKLIFVWAMRTASSIEWIDKELESAIQALYDAGIEISTHLYVTREDSISFTEEESMKKDTIDGPQAYKQSESNDNPPTKELKPAGIFASAQSSPDLRSSVSLPTMSTLHFRRPDVGQVISEALVDADGEMAVAVCGPISLSASVRRAVALSDGGRFGIYLHAESFGW